MSEIIFNSPSPGTSLNDQVENFQTTLASLNQRVISLQEALQEKDQEIAKLKYTSEDQTLTIVGALIKLYQYIFLSGKIT